MLNHVENDEAGSAPQPDPEVQAGRALRRLRLARNWSQEEVAERMTAYGYEFHQTMIAKIESAQRPLRVRELVDFAALYGVDVQQLVYPATNSLEVNDEEIAEVTVMRDAIQARAGQARAQLDAARAAIHEAEVAYQASASEAAVLEERLTALLAERQKLIDWESVQDSSSSEGVGKAQRGGLVLTRTPGEQVMIGDDIAIEVIQVVGNKVRLRITAPDPLPVYRKEVWATRRRQATPAGPAAKRSPRRARY
jgi:carbon storage regulator CsrA